MSLDSTIELHAVSFNDKRLDLLTDGERGFLLVAGHLINEMTALNKLMLWTIPVPPEEGIPDDRLSFVKAFQHLMIARIFTGKLYEGWDAINKSWSSKYIGSTISKDVELSDEFKKTKKELNKYFNSSNCLIKKVRNNFGFHYSVQEIGEAWQNVKSEPLFGILVGDQNGNNFHVAAEQAAIYGMLKVINRSDQHAALDEFANDIFHVARLLTDFLEAVIIKLLQKCGKKIESDETILVSEAKNLSAVQIPFFVFMDRVPTSSKRLTSMAHKT